MASQGIPNPGHLDSIIRMLQENDRREHQTFLEGKQFEAEERERQSVQENRKEYNERLKEQQKEVEAEHKRIQERFGLTQELDKAKFGLDQFEKQQAAVKNLLSGIPVPGMSQTGPVSNTALNNLNYTPVPGAPIPSGGAGYTPAQGPGNTGLTNYMGDVAGKPLSVDLPQPEAFARRQAGLESIGRGPETEQERQKQLQMRLTDAQNNVAAMERQESVNKNHLDVALVQERSATAVASMRQFLGALGLDQIIPQEEINSIIKEINDGTATAEEILARYPGQMRPIAGMILQMAARNGMVALNKVQAQAVNTNLGKFKHLLTLFDEFNDVAPDTTEHGLATSLWNTGVGLGHTLRDTIANQRQSAVAGYAAEFAKDAGNMGNSSDTDIVLALKSFIPGTDRLLIENIDMRNRLWRRVRSSFDANLSNISPTRRDAIWQRMMAEIDPLYNMRRRDPGYQAPGLGSPGIQQPQAPAGNRQIPTPRPQGSAQPPVNQMPARGGSQQPPAGTDARYWGIPGNQTGGVPGQTQPQQNQQVVQPQGQRKTPEELMFELWEKINGPMPERPPIQPIQPQPQGTQPTREPVIYVDPQGNIQGLNPQQPTIPNQPVSTQLSNPPVQIQSQLDKQVQALGQILKPGQSIYIDEKNNAHILGLGAAPTAQTVQTPTSTQPQTQKTQPTPAPKTIQKAQPKATARPRQVPPLKKGQTLYIDERGNFHILEDPNAKPSPFDIPARRR